MNVVHGTEDLIDVIVCFVVLRNAYGLARTKEVQHRDVFGDRGSRVSSLSDLFIRQTQYMSLKIC